jgi:hypothetical protein
VLDSVYIEGRRKWAWLHFSVNARHDSNVGGRTYKVAVDGRPVSFILLLRS